MADIAPRLAQKYDLQLNKRNAPFKLMFGFLPERSENSLVSMKESGRVCLDTAALWESKEDLMKATQFLGGAIKHVYLSNVQGSAKYSPLTKGVLPLESFLTKLAKGGFSGDFTFLFAPERIFEGHEEQMIDTLTQSRAFFDEYFTEVFEKKEDGGRTIA